MLLRPIYIDRLVNYILSPHILFETHAQIFNLAGSGANRLLGPSKKHLKLKKTKNRGIKRNYCQRGFYMMGVLIEL
jgi:hypothetical protein